MKKLSLKNLNQSKLLAGCLLLAMFLIMLVCNCLTGLFADDYTYHFSFADGSRISSLTDIFTSMAAHRTNTNGRIVAHFLVQLFFLLPTGVFKVLNSLMLVAAVVLIYYIAGAKAKRNNLLLCGIFGAIWVMTTAFGQVILWQTGSINYLWACVFSMLYLLPFINKFLYDKDIKNPVLQVLFVLFSFLVGAYSENCGAAIIFCSVVLLALCKLYKKQRGHIYIYIYISGNGCPWLPNYDTGSGRAFC